MCGPSLEWAEVPRAMGVYGRPDCIEDEQAGRRMHEIVRRISQAWNATQTARVVHESLLKSCFEVFSCGTPQRHLLNR